MVRPDVSTPRLGRILNRDHSTIVYAIQAVEKRIAASDEERAIVDGLLDLWLGEARTESRIAALNELRGRIDRQIAELQARRGDTARLAA